MNFMNGINLIIDFDSTFVKVETLDLLAEICFNNYANKSQKIKNISNITNQAMNGEIPFDKALVQRLKILRANKDHIVKAAEIIKKNISKSFLNNKKFFEKYSDNCFIVSGGFKEIILPTVMPYGFKKENVFGNTFIYNNNDQIKTIDRDNPLSKDHGKIKIMQEINKPKSITQKRKISIILGDGYTDYEIKKFNEAKYFIQFTENINRTNLNNKADKIAHSFDEAIDFINKI